MSKNQPVKHRKKVEPNAERTQLLWFAEELSLGHGFNVDARNKLSRILFEIQKGFIGQTSKEYRGNAGLHIAARKVSMTDTQKQVAVLHLRTYADVLPNSKRGRPKSVDDKVAAATAVLWSHGDRKRAQEIGGFSFDACSLALFDSWKSGNKKFARSFASTVVARSPQSKANANDRAKRRAAARMRPIAGEIYKLTSLRDAALQWLKLELPIGVSVDLDALQGKAESAGHAWRTVQDVAKELNVKRQRGRPSRNQKSNWQR